MNLNLNPYVIGLFVLEWTVRIIMLFIVPRNRKPSSANAWLLLIMVAPIFGVLFFYMFGNPKLPKSRLKSRRHMDRMTSQELEVVKSTRKDVVVKIENSNHVSIARLATVLGGLPPMGGNSVESLPNYEEIFTRIISDITQAKQYIHIQYYIAAYDATTEPFFEAIREAVERGVKVRFLYDRIASTKYPGHKKMRKELADMGVEFKEMLPLKLKPGKEFTRPDLRNHRKIVVIDGTVAYSGSQNLIDKSYNRKDGLYYEELVLRMQGPIVWQFATIFRGDWYAETGQKLEEFVSARSVPEPVGTIVAQVLPSGPAHDHDNNLKIYTSMIHAAKKRVGIVVPYFIPDESFLEALTAAAQRGVEVTMINSEVIDKILAGHAQRSYYDELLEAGVHVYLYEKPVFLHTKQVLIDDEVAIIGSSNLDIRSFRLDLEVTTIVYDESVAKSLEKIEAGYLKKSKKVTLKAWHKRSFKLKMLDSIARLTAAFQ
jgi:cardiolipin synthase